ncbi:NAD(P)-binding protein [Atractiella rhizophila]|nr:NAD(P)-binding protein [Atractiella rhizophila]
MSVYVVTGAARGIGAAFVQQFSADAANTVFALVRTRSTFIYTPSSNVHVIETGEIGETEAYTTRLEHVVKEIETKAGRVDVLVNNAAVMHGKMAREYVETEGGLNEFIKHMNENWDVNVVGVNVTIFALLPLLKRSADPKVISISTGFADLDVVHKARLPVALPYSSTKAALNMSIAKWSYVYPEIKFLSVCPGYVNTLNRPPTEEDIGKHAYMMSQFRKINPEFKGAITPAESVKDIVGFIDNLTPEQSGDFISHYGGKNWLGN